jgi:hypothetical protein
MISHLSESVSARNPSGERRAIIAVGAFPAPVDAYRGNVIASKRPPWLSLPTNAVQNLADVFLEVCLFPAGESKIDEIDLGLPLEAAKLNPVWVRSEKLAKALLRYSAVSRC